ncbi:MAG: hypothetical protein ACXWC9_01315 [Pseudobdellovibrionaceae bacterium]
MAKQLSFQNTNWRHRYSHGGSLRQKRAGRGARPLSSKVPIHLVFKANKDVIRGGFRLHRRFALIHHLLQKYQLKFFIKVEQVSIQGDHIHLLIRTTRRSLYQNFFRVLAGQIAQRFEKEGLLTVASVTDTPTGFGSKSVLQRKKLVVRTREFFGRRKAVGMATVRLKTLWKHRPLTRVVKGYRAYKTVQDYIQLNEKEALGGIPYRSERLKGMSSADWAILWS